MPRPFVYKRIDRILENGKDLETVVLGHPHMWGVMHGDLWVTIAKQDTHGIKNWKNNGLKYQKLYFSTQHMAQTHADRLNKLFYTNEYKVAKI